MNTSTIIFESSAGVARIYLNRPEIYNSFNQVMSKEVQQALDHCAERDEIRAIILSGAGKAFSAGQDLKEAIDPHGPDIKRIVDEHYNPLISRMRTIEKPIICAVNGVAAGAGANVALAGDIVVAKRSAVFIQAFSNIGLIPDSGGTFHLPRLIGWQKASALMMLADKVDAVEAERMGMIYKWFDDDRFETEVEALAQKVAAMPTRGLALTKKLLNLSASNDLMSQLNAEGDMQVLAAATSDFKEGVKAFIEKRKPNFKGK
ncbi:MAG: 2-(1,2-epoxy-1,2-dihydrophenyl)acetyl-CoA isomerase PaaG [Salibacteraceae bacterium]